MPSVSANVLAVGMTCPVGLHSRAALAAMDADITRFVRRTDLFDSNGEPVRTAALSIIDSRSTRTERAAVLARYALAEVLADVPVSIRSLKCFIALPERESDGLDADDLTRI